MKNKSKWLSSKDVQKAVNINSCKLMHYRTQNKLDFKKKGNAYLYSLMSVQKLNLIINNNEKK